MAKLALTIAGAAAGAAAAYFTGNVQFIQLGMSLGALAGGIIGSLAFPGQGPHIYGPRVNDMQVSSSAPGMVIPILYGTMRFGGQIIWSTGLVETTTTTSQGAKGMPSATQTTYSYTVSYAAGFCQGPAHITRIWGDSKLIYNRGGSVANNKGTWSSSVLYSVNDHVSWENSAGVTLTYICLVQNEGALPSNGSFWAEDLVDSAANVTKYNSPILYPGDELQNPSPVIVASEGADVTPAYRGLCYLVWENMPLADFGNRLPNIRAEVTSNSASSFPLSIIGWPLSNSSKPFFTISDYTGATTWTWQGLANGGTGIAAGYIMRVDLTLNKVVASGTIDCSGLTCATQDPSVPDGTMRFVPGSDQVPGYTGCLSVDLAGSLWGTATLSGQRALVKVDPWTFRGLEAIDIHQWTDGGGSIQGVIHTQVAQASTLLGDGTDYIVGVGTGFSSDYDVFVYGTALDPITHIPFFGRIGQYYGFGGRTITQTYPVFDGKGNIFILSENSPRDGGWHIEKINFLSGAVLPKGAPPLPKGPILTNVQVHSFAGISSRGTPEAMFYDPVDSTLVLLTNVGTILKLDAGSFAVLDEVGSDTDPQFGCSIQTPWYNSHILGVTLPMAGFSIGGPGNVVQMAFRGQIQNGIFVAPSLLSVNSGRNVVIFNATTFEPISSIDLANFHAAGSPVGSSWPTVDAGAGTMYFDTGSNALVCVSEATVPAFPTFPHAYALYRAYLERLNTSGLTADIIAADICAKAGMAPGDYNTSQLAAISVQGYPISNLQTPKAMLEALAQGYFFEARESDFVLQFVPRGQPSLLTVPEDDLGLAKDQASVTESVGQEQDVPKDVEIIYTNPQTDYQQGQQKRIRHSRTKKTLNKTSISLPLVMNAVQAAQLADKILWTAELERHTFKTNFWKAYYMLLDPCDVITIDYHGSALTVRVTENTIGQNFAMMAKLTSEDSNSYVSVATGNNGTFVGQVVKGLSTTLLWLLDIPYVTDLDADASGNTGYYFVVAPNGHNGSWPAGVLYTSSDNLSFQQVDAVTSQMAYGITQNALALPPTGVFAWDFENTLTVRMSNGNEPGSDTMLNVLNGVNVALLYPSLEIIQFATVVSNEDGTLTLSDLLRGRRGTDDFIGSHTSGETIFFLSEQGGIRHEQISLTVLNLLRYYKAITVGADLNSNPVSTQFTVSGKDLKPYAPSGLTVTPSGGDLLLAWIRRTRLGGGWNDGIGFVPLNETSESYDIDIVNGAGVVKRTFANITPPGGITDGWATTPTETYTAAQQATDGYVAGTGWKWRVYQNSVQVGRGFVSTLALP